MVRYSMWSGTDGWVFMTRTPCCLTRAHMCGCGYLATFGWPGRQVRLPTTGRAKTGLWPTLSDREIHGVNAYQDAKHSMPSRPVDVGHRPVLARPVVGNRTWRPG